MWIHIVEILGLAVVCAVWGGLLIAADRTGAPTGGCGACARHTTCPEEDCDADA